MYPLFLLLTLLYVASPCHAVALRPSHSLPSSRSSSSLSPLSSVRATAWDDVARLYGLAYGNRSGGCPGWLNVTRGVAVDGRNVGEVAMSDLVEDGVVCEGADSLTLVSGAAFRIPGSLESVGLGGLLDALRANSYAEAIANHSASKGMLVGWHASERTCGSVVYAPNTVYFFVRDAAGFALDFRRPTEGITELVTVAPYAPALLVVPDSPNICILAGSGPDLDLEPNSAVTLSVNGADPVTLPIVTPTPIPASTPTSSTTSDGDSNSSNEDDPPFPSAEPPSPPPTSAGVPAVDASSVTNPQENGDPVPTSEASAVVETTPQVPPPPSPPPANATSPVVPGSGAGATGDGSEGNDGDDVVEATVEPSSSGPACFPGGALVGTSNGKGKVKMSDLLVGDDIGEGNGGKILFFTHRDVNVRASFVRLEFARGARALIVSGGHYVYVSGELKPAEDVRVGDALVCAKTRLPRIVVGTHRVCATGLYNPQTSSGVIAVDGVLASTYTTAVDPRTAHRLVAAVETVTPRRLAVAVGKAMSHMLRHGAPVGTLTALKMVTHWWSW